MNGIPTLDNIPNDALISILNNLNANEVIQCRTASSILKSKIDALSEKVFVKEAFQVKSKSTKDVVSPLFTGNPLPTKSSIKSYNYIVNFFGGHQQIYLLPVLDLKKVVKDYVEKYAEKDYIDFVKPEHMHAPLMRGQDLSGRLFFAVRGKSLKRPVVLSCQVFFQRYPGGDTWVTGGVELVKLRHYENGFDHDTTKNLKLLMAKKPVIGEKGIKWILN